jgi:glutamyl-tRNA reductase
MGVFTLGLSHFSAPFTLRERFAVASGQLKPLLQSYFGQSPALIEVAIVSTCNRTELYVHARDSSLIIPSTIDWLAKWGGVSETTVRDHSYIHQGRDAARHIFRVACGLDSMVLGEPQILGQLKQAMHEADAAGTLGSTLHQMFQRSFAVAKKVRSTTEIGAHSISMAAATVKLAAQLFENLTQTRVLLVGAGEMIALVGTHFAARMPQQMVVANRTLERGEMLAAHLGAKAMRLVELPQRLAEFDIVVSCTASSLPIIGLGAVERALKLRKHRPMFMVDLAVPRDIEPEVAELPDVYHYSLDDLSSIVDNATEKRQAAVQQAEVIIEAGVQSFSHWLNERDLVPLIQSLHNQAEAWRRQELKRAHKRLAQGETIDAALESMGRALTQKMLHGALTELHLADAAQREIVVQNISRFFLRNNAFSTSLTQENHED